MVSAGGPPAPQGPDREPPAGRSGEGERVEVVLGLVAAPGTPGDLAAVLLEDVRAGLDERFAGVHWQVQLVRDPLVSPPAGDDEIVDAARRMLLNSGWDLTVVLTDLPLHVGRRPVLAHASAVHAAAVLSVPALGAVNLRRRARGAVLHLVERLLADSPTAPVEDARARAGRGVRLNRRLRELGADAEVGPEAGEGARSGTVRFSARVLWGNVHLLAGMVRTNRPWRLAVQLSRALVAAITAGVFALVTSDIWSLADHFGVWRLAGVGLGSVAAITATLIVGAGLWERARHARMREQVVLFNIATTATVLIGVLALYGTLFVLSSAAALVLVVPSLLAQALGHPVGFGDYAELAWLTSSLATVGGALGAGLETDETVRQAAYAYRSDASVDDLA